MENEDKEIVQEFLQTTEQPVPVPPEAPPDDFISKTNKLTQADRYHTQFSESMNEANTKMAQKLTDDEESETYKGMKKSIGKAIEQTAKNEQLKAEHDAQIIELQNIIIQNEHEIEQLRAQKTGYNKKRERRQYIYEGVAPILKMVGIDTPSSIVLMYFLTTILVIPYIFWKFIRGIFVTPLAGMKEEDRKGLVKGYLWTLLAIVITGIILTAVLLLLSHYGII